jgi:hypothetical protein
VLRSPGGATSILATVLPEDPVLPGDGRRAFRAGRRALLRLARLRVTVRLVTATTMSAAPSASALLIRG